MTLAMYNPCKECGMDDNSAFTIGTIQHDGVDGYKILKCLACGSAYPIDLWNKINPKEGKK